MPELPEVETARRVIDPILTGNKIARVWAATDPIVFANLSPAQITRRLQNKSVLSTQRHGKYLWLNLDQAPRPIFHLGMTGRFELYDQMSQRPRFCKLEITLNSGRRIGYVNVRRLGRVLFAKTPENESPIAKLGQDPFLNMPSPNQFTKALSSRKTPIKSLLLNQQFLAGIGNWIADEVLYQSGINPHRKANTLSVDQTKALHRSIRLIINHAVKVGADDNQFPKDWMFHNRWGRSESKTFKGEPIQYDTIGGRTTAWAPTRQK